MSTKTTTKNQGAKTAVSKTSTKVTTNKSGKVIAVTIQENGESNTELKPIASHVAKSETVVGNTKENNAGETKTAPAVKSKSKKETQKKAVTPGKTTALGSKKIRIAATCYHYYRHFLKEFLSHVASARFQKSPESYDGHITVLETDKAKVLKALEQWSKENPDTKELFWDVKK